MFTAALGLDERLHARHAATSGRARSIEDDAGHHLELALAVAEGGGANHRHEITSRSKPVSGGEPRGRRSRLHAGDGNRTSSDFEGQRQYSVGLPGLRRAGDHVDGHAVGAALRRSTSSAPRGSPESREWSRFQPSRGLPSARSIRPHRSRLLPSRPTLPAVKTFERWRSGTQSYREAQVASRSSSSSPSRRDSSSPGSRLARRRRPRRNPMGLDATPVVNVASASPPGRPRVLRSASASGRHHRVATPRLRQPSCSSETGASPTFISRKRTFVIGSSVGFLHSPHGAGRRRRHSSNWLVTAQRTQGVVWRQRLAPLALRNGPHHDLHHPEGALARSEFFERSQAPAETVGSPPRQ